MPTAFQKASGTKPSQLAKSVPMQQQDEEIVNLKLPKKSKEQSLPIPQQLESAQQMEITPEEQAQLDAWEMSTLEDQASDSTMQKAGQAMAFGAEVGIPTAVDIGSQLAGVALTKTPQTGVMLGKTAGSIINTATAPALRALSNAILKATGNETENVDAKREIVDAGLSEILNAALPAYLSKTGIIMEREASKLATKSASEIERNLERNNQMREMGVEPGPSSTFEGTPFNAVAQDQMDVTRSGFGLLNNKKREEFYLKAKKQKDDFIKSFDKLKSAFGVTVENVDEGGVRVQKEILRPEAIDQKISALSNSINEKAKMASEYALNKRFNIEPIVSEFEKALSSLGIQTNGKPVKSSVFNSLSDKEKPLVRKYNELIEKYKVYSPGELADKGGVTLKELQVIRPENLMSDMRGTSQERLLPPSRHDLLNKRFDLEKELSSLGIQTNGKPVKASVFNGLSDKGKRLAREYNELNELIDNYNPSEFEGFGAPTATQEPLNFRENKVNPDGSIEMRGNNIRAEETSASFGIDNVPPNKRFIPEQQTRSIPGSTDRYSKDFGSQGSLGIIELSDALNEIVGQRPDGKPITRAQDLAARMFIPTGASSRNAERAGLTLSEIVDLTSSIQDLASLGNKPGKRDAVDKAFGHISNIARSTRNEVNAKVLSDAAQDAYSRGDTALGKQLEKTADQLSNQNILYSKRIDSWKDMQDRLFDSPSGFVEALVYRAPEKELDNFLLSFSQKEKEALKTSVLEDFSERTGLSSGRVDPAAIKTTLDSYKKNGVNRLEKIIGKEDYTKLKNLMGIASVLEAGEGKLSEHAARAQAKKIAFYLTGWVPGIASDLLTVFTSYPRLGLELKKLPQYEAIQKYILSGNKSKMIEEAVPTLGIYGATTAGAAGLRAKKEKQKQDQTKKNIEVKKELKNFGDLEY